MRQAETSNSLWNIVVMAKVKCAGDKEIVIPVSNDRTQMSFDATNYDRTQSEERIATTFSRSSLIDLKRGRGRIVGDRHQFPQTKSMYNQSYMVHSHRNTTNSRNWLICVKNRDAAIDAMYVECRAEKRSRDRGPCLCPF